MGLLTDDERASCSQTALDSTRLTAPLFVFALRPPSPSRVSGYTRALPFESARSHTDAIHSRSRCPFAAPLSARRAGLGRPRTRPAAVRASVVRARRQNKQASESERVTKANRVPASRVISSIEGRQSPCAHLPNEARQSSQRASERVHRADSLAPGDKLNHKPH